MEFTLMQISQGLFSSYGLMLSRFDQKSETLTPMLSSDMPYNQLFQYSSVLNHLKEAGSHGDPFVYVDSFNCLWLFLPREQMKEIFFAGPVLACAVSKQQVIQHYRHRDVSQGASEQLAELYNQLPIMELDEFNRLVSFLCELICHRPLSLSTFGQTESRLANQELAKQEIAFYQMQQRDFELSAKIEKYYTDCVRNGDVERLSENYPSATFKSLTELGPNQVRSIKNNMIVLVALLTRAAIEGGLATEVAFPLSDMYIFRIESAHDMATVVKVASDVPIGFAKRVRENRFKLQYSECVNKCCRYIVTHLYDPIKVSDVAKAVQMNVDSLERRFKKETGTSVSEYIRKAKMEEAKMLLWHSNFSLTEICYRLGYSSQSQFITNFKRAYGVTPHAFRRGATKK